MGAWSFYQHRRPKGQRLSIFALSRIPLFDFGDRQSAVPGKLRNFLFKKFFNFRWDVVKSPFDCSTWCEQILCCAFCSSKRFKNGFEERNQTFTFPKLFGNIILCANKCLLTLYFSFYSLVLNDLSLSLSEIFMIGAFKGLHLSRCRINGWT